MDPFTALTTAGLIILAVAVVATVWQVQGRPQIKLRLTAGPVRETAPDFVPAICPNPHRPLKGASMPTIMTDSQQIPYTLEFDDKKGNPTAAPPGVVPAWTVSDPTILAVNPAADGLSAVVTALGVTGTAQVQATGGLLSPVFDTIQVIPGAAVGLGLKPGVPTEQP